MKIIVLGGSPKGEISVTMQYIKYLEMINPQHEFKRFQVTKSINKYIKNSEAMDELFKEIESADGIIWAFPLYYCLVHSNYKRFIELILSHPARDVFKDKHCVSLSTSINYFDHTAHNYIHAISEDLGMNFVDYYSAAMNDLIKTNERDKLEKFGMLFFNAIKNKEKYSKVYPIIPKAAFNYKNSEPAGKISTDKNVVVITDSVEGNIGTMVNQYSNQFEKPAAIYTLDDIGMKGGCQGCIKCGEKNICVYNGKDNHIEFYNSVLMKADVLVYAGNIEDRYLSWKWKQFFDRLFVNTHRRMFRDKQFLFMISGPLSMVSDLKEILSAYVDFQKSNLTGFVTDENTTSSELDSIIKTSAQRAIKGSELKYHKPNTFLGIGGMKVFRDEVYSTLRVIFKADHREYKRDRLYDFPSKKPLKLLAFKFLYHLTKIPFISNKIYSGMAEFMIMPFEDMFKKLEKQGSI